MFPKTLLAIVLATTAFAVPLVGELETRQNCADVTVFFARGTTELGALGAIVGPEFQTDLRSALNPKSLSFNGIDYPASFAGYFAGGDAGGARTMANNVTTTAKSCPKTKIVMSGYRQAPSFTPFIWNIS